MTYNFKFCPAFKKNATSPIAEMFKYETGYQRIWSRDTDKEIHELQIC